MKPKNDPRLSGMTDAHILRNEHMKKASAAMRALPPVTREQAMAQYDRIKANSQRTKNRRQADGT